MRTFQASVVPPNEALKPSLFGDTACATQWARASPEGDSTSMMRQVLPTMI